MRLFWGLKSCFWVGFSSFSKHITSLQRMRWQVNLVIFDCMDGFWGIFYSCGRSFGELKLFERKNHKVFFRCLFSQLFHCNFFILWLYVDVSTRNYLIQRLLYILVLKFCEFWSTVAENDWFYCYKHHGENLNASEYWMLCCWIELQNVTGHYVLNWNWLFFDSFMVIRWWNISIGNHSFFVIFL